jgi:hypothetical protein
VVDQVEAATTVMTCLAEPVEKRSDSAPPTCVEGRAVGGVDRLGEIFGCGRAELAAWLCLLAVGLGGWGSATARGPGCGWVWVGWVYGRPDVQAATAITTTAARTSARPRRRS